MPTVAQRPVIELNQASIRDDDSPNDTIWSKMIPNAEVIKFLLRAIFDAHLRTQIYTKLIVTVPLVNYYFS